jgi:hypothetical protein
MNPRVVRVVGQTVAYLEAGGLGVRDIHVR